MNLPYAETCPFWKTGRSAPDVWVAKTIELLEKFDCEVVGHAFARQQCGQAAFMFEFCIGGDRFKIVWPVLPSESGNIEAAARQAATMVYHDVKAKINAAHARGHRAAFFGYLLLPDGRSAEQLAAPELVQQVPQFLLEHK